MRYIRIADVVCGCALLGELVRPARDGHETGLGLGQRLKSEECLSAGCLAASVCNISCSHFEFFKWLLGPAYTYTHTHTHTGPERDLLTCIEQSKAC